MPLFARLKPYFKVANDDHGAPISLGPVYRPSPLQGSQEIQELLEPGGRQLDAQDSISASIDQASTTKKGQIQVTNQKITDSVSTSNENISRPKQRLWLLRSGWLWEILAMYVYHRSFVTSPIKKRLFIWTSRILALTCQVAIFLLLIHMDKTPVSRWKVPISMNAVIAVFSTISKSALLVPVAACLSQLKWHYFEKTRTLRDMEVFDRSSRGPLGSLELLFYINLKAPIASVGAIIVFLSLAIDPVTQQILSFPLDR
jgi:hypothetical protein